MDWKEEILKRSFESLNVQHLLELENYSVGSESFVSTLISAFLESAAREVREIERLWQARSLEPLCRMAHGLKSSSANLGALPVSQLCNQIETRIRNPAPAKRMDDLSKVIQELVVQHQKLESELKMIQLEIQKASVPVNPGTLKKVS